MAEEVMFTVPYITYAEVSAIKGITVKSAEDLEDRNSAITFPASRIQFVTVEKFDTPSGELVYANVRIDGLDRGVMVRKTPILFDRIRQTIWRNMFGVEEGNEKRVYVW